MQPFLIPSPCWGPPRIDKARVMEPLPIYSIHIFLLYFTLIVPLLYANP